VRKGAMGRSVSNLQNALVLVTTPWKPAHCSPMLLLGGEVESVEANAVCSLDGAAADTELRGKFAI